MSFIGRQINLGIGKESVRGTAVAPTFWLPAISKGIEDKFTLAKDEAAYGVIETDADAKVVKKWSEGEIEALVRDKSFGLILLALFGTVDTDVDTPEAGVNTHNFSVSQSVQHQSLTLALKHPEQDLAFALGMITEFTLTVELENFVKYTVGFMGIKSDAASSTPAYTTENEFVPQHVAVKFADDLAGLDAATPIKSKAVTITFTKNAETDDIVGSVDPNDVLNKQFQVEGTIELLFDETTYKTMALAGTKKAMRVDTENTDITIGAATNPRVKFDFAKVILEEWARTSDSDDLIRQTLTFKAYYSAADTQLAIATLINTQVSY